MVADGRPRREWPAVDGNLRPHGKYEEYLAPWFHRGREAIAAGIAGLLHILGNINPADTISRYCGYQQVWQLLQPLLPWQCGHLGIGTYAPGDGDDNG
jgi:hypothetical protein